MNGYTFIGNLFKSVLFDSPIIQGRFNIAYRYGAQEINSDILGEVLTDLGEAKVYPLCVMAPPHSTVEISGKAGEWERLRIIMFFVDTTFYTNRTVKSSNPKTKTSTQSVPQEWQNMKIAAVNFVRALSILQRSTINSLFRIPNNQTLIVPISSIGTDRVSGVRLAFDFDLYIGCDIPDYTDYTGDLNVGYTSKVHEVSSDWVYNVIPGNYLIDKIIVLPGSSASIKIGSTLNGNEYFNTTEIAPIQGGIFDINLLASSPSSIYFTGIPADSKIIIITQNVPS